MLLKLAAEFLPGPGILILKLDPGRPQGVGFGDCFHPSPEHLIGHLGDLLVEFLPVRPASIPRSGDGQ